MSLLVVSSVDLLQRHQAFDEILDLLRGSVCLFMRRRVVNSSSGLCILYRFIALLFHCRYILLHFIVCGSVTPDRILLSIEIRHEGHAEPRIVLEYGCERLREQIRHGRLFPLPGARYRTFHAIDDILCFSNEVVVPMNSLEQYLRYTSNKACNAVRVTASELGREVAYSQQAVHDRSSLFHHVAKAGLFVAGESCGHLLSSVFKTFRSTLRLKLVSNLLGNGLESTC